MRSRALLVLCLVALGFVALMVSPAFAAGPETGPPNASGVWAYCDVAVQGPNLDSDQSVEVACQYGPSSTTLMRVDVAVQGVSGSSVNNQSMSWGPSTSSDAIVSTNANGKYRASHYFPSGIVGLSYPITTAFVTTIGIERGSTDQYVGSVSTCGGSPPGCDPLVPAGVASSFSLGSSGAVFSEHYWPGSSPGFGAPDGGDGGFVEPGDVDGGDTTEGNEDCGSWVHIACHFRNALRTVFVPQHAGDDIEEMLDTASENFPFSVIAEVVGTFDAFSGELAEGLDPDGVGSGDCLWEPMNVTLPTWGGNPSYHFNPGFPIGPPGHCSFSEDWQSELVDLFGFRTFVRALAAVFLWLGISVRIIRSFAGPGSTDLAPVDES